jgi:hypothetical protein
MSCIFYRQALLKIFFPDRGARDMKIDVATGIIPTSETGTTYLFVFVVLM